MIGVSDYVTKCVFKDRSTFPNFNCFLIIFFSKRNFIFLIQIKSKFSEMMGMHWIWIKFWLCSLFLEFLSRINQSCGLSSISVVCFGGWKFIEMLPILIYVKYVYVFWIVKLDFNFYEKWSFSQNIIFFSNSNSIKKRRWKYLIKFYI